MKSICAFAVSLLALSSASALDRLPQNFEALINPAGPAVEMHLGDIQLSQIDAKDCSQIVKYNGETILGLGDQFYKLVTISTVDQKICKTDTDFKKFSVLILRFLNTEYGNEVRLIVDQNELPFVNVVLGQGNTARAKVK